MGLRCVFGQDAQTGRPVYSACTWNVDPTLAMASFILPTLALRKTNSRIVYEYVFWGGNERLTLVCGCLLALAASTSPVYIMYTTRLSHSPDGNHPQLKSPIQPFLGRFIATSNFPSFLGRDHVTYFGRLLLGWIPYRVTRISASSMLTAANGRQQPAMG